MFEWFRRYVRGDTESVEAARDEALREAESLKKSLNGSSTECVERRIGERRIGDRRSGEAKCFV